MKNFIINAKNIRKLAVAVIWILVWQLIYVSVNNQLLLASPLQVFERLLELIFIKSFWITVLLSIYRIIVGFLLALLVGVILAIFTTTISFLCDLFQPIIGIIKATPVASFIILTHVWMKSNEIPIFMSFLMVLPIVWANVSEGIRKTDIKLLEMAAVFKFSFFQIIRNIYLPSVLPYFMAAFTTGLGMAWKAGVAAEVITTPRYSIGAKLYEAKIYLKTVDLFVYTFVIIFLSIFIEKTFTHFIKLLVKQPK